MTLASRSTENGVSPPLLTIDEIIQFPTHKSIERSIDHYSRAVGIRSNNPHRGFCVMTIVAITRTITNTADLQIASRGLPVIFFFPGGIGGRRCREIAGRRAHREGRLAVRAAFPLVTPSLLFLGHLGEPERDERGGQCGGQGGLHMRRDDRTRHWPTAPCRARSRSLAHSTRPSVRIRAPQRASQLSCRNMRLESQNEFCDVPGD